MVFGITLTLKIHKRRLSPSFERCCFDARRMRGFIWVTPSWRVETTLSLPESSDSEEMDDAEHLGIASDP